MEAKLVAATARRADLASRVARRERDLIAAVLPADADAATLEERFPGAVMEV